MVLLQLPRVEETAFFILDFCFLCVIIGLLVYSILKLIFSVMWGDNVLFLSGKRH